MVFALPFGDARWQPRWPRPLSLLSTAALLVGLSTLSIDAHAKDDDSKKDDSAETKDEKASEKADNGGDEGGESGGGSAEANASLSSSGSSSRATPGVGVAALGGMKPTVLFLEAGLRSDIGLLLNRTSVNRFEDAEDFDVKSFGPLLHVGILTHFFWKFRIGAALGYGFNYRLTERLTPFQKEQREENEDFQEEEWDLGPLYTADIRLEFSQLLTENLYVLLTPRGGIQAVIPGEDLKRETEALEGAYNVRQGPQLGALGGIDIGARYLVKDWLSVRMTFGYAYFTQGLLRAKRKSDTVEYDNQWRLSGARVGGNLGVEAVF